MDLFWCSTSYILAFNIASKSNVYEFNLEMIIFIALCLFGSFSLNEFIKNR